MATIPKVTDIQRYIPQGQKPVAVDRSAGVVGEAVAGLSRGLIDLGESIDRRAKFDATNAAVEYENDLAGLDQKFEARSFGDADTVDSISKAYDEEAQKLLDERAAKLGSTGAKEYFNLAATQRKGVRSVRNTGVAIGKYRDWGQDKIKGNLVALIQNRSADPDPFGAVADANALIDAGAEFFDNDAARENFRAEKIQEYAVARYSTLDQKGRESFIKSEFFSKLPVDMQATVKTQVETRSRKLKAMTTIEGLMNRGASQAQIDKAIMDEPDPETRDLMYKEQDYFTARERTRRVNQQSDLLDSWYVKVRQGFDPMNIPPEQLRVLGDKINTLDSAYSDFRSAGGAGSGYPKQTDPETLDTMFQLLGSNDPVGARDFFNANRHRFDAGDYAKFSEATSKDPDAPKALFPVQTRLSAALEERNLGKDKKRAGELRQALENWNARFQQANPGKEPTDAQIDEAIDRAFVEVKPAGWFSRPTYSFETGAPIQTSPPQMRWIDVSRLDPAIATKLRERYPSASEADLLKRYNAIQEAARK